MGFIWKTGLQRIATVGECYGPLGIRHTNIDGRWRVTHLPTGFVAGSFADETSARRFVETLAEDPEWDQLELTPEGYVLSIPQRLATRCTELHHQIIVRDEAV